MKRTYPVIIEGSETEGYSAWFPDVPGCVGADDTIEACYNDAVKALKFHLAGMVEDGDMAPLSSKLSAISDDDKKDIAALMLITINLPGKKQRCNLTIDSAVLAAIDNITNNRSAFVESAVVAALSKM